MALSPTDFLNGLFSLIFVSVTIIVGLRIALHYFKIKNRVFLLVGLGWAGLCSAWYPSTISFVSVLITGEGLEPMMYFFIGNVILHLAATLYILGVTEMIYKEKQKIIIGIFVIIGIIYNIYFYWALLTDPSIIGTLEGYMDVTYVRLVSIYLFLLIILLCVFTLLLGRQSLKSEQPDLKLKGKLIMIAIILYVLGAILDGLFELTALTLIIARSVLISSSILFYLAYMMPEFIKKRLKKED